MLQKLGCLVRGSRDLACVQQNILETRLIDHITIVGAQVVKLHLENKQFRGITTKMAKVCKECITIESSLRNITSSEPLAKF